MGTGGTGGKASGLMHIQNFLEESSLAGDFPGIEVSIPGMLVIRSDVFDSFMQINKLQGLTEECPSDRVIAEAFIRGQMPPHLVGSLYEFVDKMRRPLAVRSSSLFEDAKEEPFAGVYMTKMIPNNQFDTATRFNKVVEAVKLVYASTFFEGARAYAQANGLDYRQEKMCVILQEVVGERRDGYFYPSVSGVLRSVNFYPTGYAEPEDGVAQLAVGLGKTIVDGGTAWTLSPRYPHKPPPFNSPRDMLRYSQTRLWAIDLKPLSVWNPIKETEYLSSLTLADAERAGILGNLVSTWDPSSDRFYPGLFGSGPRLVNFAPLFSDDNLRLSDFMEALLRLAEKVSGEAVEIEFAMNLDPRGKSPVRFGFLQVRPMTAFTETVEFNLQEFPPDRIVAVSETALGNGNIETIRDVVFIKKESFDPAKTSEMAMEIAEINGRLIQEGTPYLLIGYGRWGSSDPWLGVPVSWPQISGAGAIIECTLPEMNPDLSQGSHFFHNLSSRGIPYFCVESRGSDLVDWEKIEGFEIRSEGRFVRHAVCPGNLRIVVDGKRRKGGVFL